MSFQRFLTETRSRVPDLDAMIIASGREKQAVGRKGYGFDPKAAKSTKQSVLTLLAVLVHRFLPVSVTGVVSPGYDLRNVCLFRPVTLWTRIHQTFSHLRMPVHTAPGVGRVIGLCL
jgi:hypothetical protein